MRFLKILWVLSSVILLSNCTKVPTGENTTSIHHQLASPYTMPATAYLALANNQTGEEKQGLLLMAAGRFIYSGQWQQGLDILTQIGPLSAKHAIEKQLLLAKIDLIRARPQEAVAKLATIQDSTQLSIYYQAQFHEMLASAYQSMGNAPDAVMERIQLEALLPDDVSKMNNRRALWLSLTTLPLPELHTLAIEATSHSVLKGWVKLALISRETYQDPHVMIDNLEQWQAQYPNHPANYILPQPFDAIRRRLYATPRKIALLLPLTGALAGPSAAIKDGFMAAFDASGGASFIKVQTYDTNQTDSAKLYEQAVMDGADFIVGPLSKAEVAAVAPLSHPVPTILLNDVPIKTQANAYQFGLSPANEAQQVAAKARKQGFSRALIIAPVGSWGDEVTAAFSQQWQANEGKVVDILQYGTRDDLTGRIKSFLHVTDDPARKNKIKPAVDTLPKRRQDFDMIFLLSYPSMARQIMPLLNYYYADNVPVYATSSVYSGTADAMKDKDLDGITFCDMPWVFTHQMGNRHWSEQLNSYNRLYALGLDSYALTNQLNQLLLFPALGVSDNSGILYLSDNQTIARILVFGKFKQGLAQRIL